MATKSPDTHEELSEQFLKCSICMERFKNARILPCYHSFCTTCLVEYVGSDSSFRCPLCKEECHVPGDGVTGLPLSVTVNGIVQLINGNTSYAYNKDETGEDVTWERCESCQEGQQVNKCIECDLNICKTCSKSHANIPATKAHRILGLEEYDILKSTDKMLVPPEAVCTAHRGALELFCTTCEVPVCQKCVNDDHQSPQHANITMVIYAKQLKGEKEEIIRRKKNLQETLKKSADVLQEQQKQIQTHVDKTKEQLSTEVENEGRSLLNELTANHRQAETIMEKEVEQLETKEKLVQSRHIAIEGFLNHDTCPVTEDSSGCDKSIGEVIDSAFPKLSLRKITLEGNLGIIQSGLLETHKEGPKSIDSSELVLYISSLPAKIKAGETVRFTIRERIPNNNIVTLRSIKATMSGNTDVKMNNVFDVQGDYRTLTGEFKCINQGRYELQVKLQGKHINGSPHFVNVLQAWQRSSQFYITGYVQNMCVDRHGNFIFAQPNNNRLVITDSTGKWKDDIQLFGFGNPFSPVDIVVTNDNTYVILDKGNNQVVVCDKKIRCFGNHKLCNPGHIALYEKTGVVYVSDDTTVKVFVYESGNYETSFSVYDTINSLTVNSDGVLYVLNGNTVSKYSSDHTRLSNISLDYAYTYLALDKNNDMYFTKNDDEILKCNPHNKPICTIRGSYYYNNSPYLLYVTAEDNCKIIAAKQNLDSLSGEILM